MAHLLEHLLFKGTPTHPTVWAEFTKRGLRANGTHQLRPHQLLRQLRGQRRQPAVVPRLAGRRDGQQLHRAQGPRHRDDGRAQRDGERRERPEPHPARSETLATMYDWHNYGKSTIGARSDVENVDIARLQAFYRLYYQPDNATLIVSGKFDAGQGAGLDRRSRSARSPKPKRTLPRLYTLDPAQDGERSVTLRRVGGAPLLLAGYHVPAGAHPGLSRRSKLLALILGDSPSGRLHKRLVEQQLRRQRVRLGLGLADPGVVLFGAQLAPGQDVDAARGELLATVEVAGRRAGHRRGARARAGEVAQGLGAALHQSGDGRRRAVRSGRAGRLAPVLPAARPRARRLTLADVQRVAHECLLPSNRTLGDLPADRQAAARAGAERGRRGRSSEGFKPQAAAAAGRGLRRHAGQHRRAHAALRARQRHEGRAAAEGHARPAPCDAR